MRRASFRKVNSVDDITTSGDLRSYVDMNRDTLLEDELYDIENILEGDDDLPLIRGTDWDDYVYEMVEDTAGVPRDHFLLSYFDLEKFKRDLLAGGDYDYISVMRRQFYYPTVW